MSTELAERNIGLIDLPEARRLIEQAGRDGDIEQLKEWYTRLGELWTTSQEEMNKAGEVKVRIEREIGVLDIALSPLGRTRPRRAVAFVLPGVPRYLMFRCRRFAGVTQADFDSTIAKLWADSFRAVSPNTVARALTASNTPQKRRAEQFELKREHWRGLKAEGLSYREIASREGVSVGAVYAALLPTAERKRQQRKRQRAYQERRKALEGQRRLTQMTGRGDVLGKAYGLADQLLPVVDQSSKQAQSREMREECDKAYSLILKARDALYRAAIEKDIAA